MHALILSGSRNPEGQTARAAKAIADGLESGGCSTETVFLPELAIERCRQCENDGWGICRTEGQCVIEDDFATVVDKLRAADLLVLATPVYFHDLAESLRGFLERVRRVGMHEVGERGIEGKKAIGICVAGGGGGGAPECAVQLERFFHNCGYEFVDMILARRQNLDMKVELLRTTGEWAARSLALV